MVRVMGIVYLILWPDESMYVGSTSYSLAHRICAHKQDSKRYDYPLYQKANEFGWDSATVVVLDECENYLEVENNYIKYYQGQLLNCRKAHLSEHDYKEYVRQYNYSYQKRNRDKINARRREREREARIKVKKNDATE